MVSRWAAVNFSRCVNSSSFTSARRSESTGAGRKNGLAVSGWKRGPSFTPVISPAVKISRSSATIRMTRGASMKNPSPIGFHRFSFSRQFGEGIRRCLTLSKED